jgi:hypothetical protein
VIKPWAIPVVVAALTVPIAAGFVVAGPGLGVAVGALVAAALVVTAVRMRPREQIEVAPSTDPLCRVLVIALAPIEDPTAASEVSEVAGRQGEVLVLAPAVNRPLAHWATDLGDAREAAQERLVLSLGTLAAAHLEARGKVGDSDAVQAVEDTLRDYSADQAILVTAPLEEKGIGARTLTELRSRLDLPLRLIEVQ